MNQDPKNNQNYEVNFHPIIKTIQIVVKELLLLIIKENENKLNNKKRSKN